MAKWLIKSEPEVYSIRDLSRDKVTRWDGVRNYQARNYLREMRTGDEVLFYHSSCEVTGVYGLALVHREAYPDPLQFDSKSEYYDAAASPAAPRWYSPELKFKSKFVEPLTLDLLRSSKPLRDMVLLRRGSRLSVQPVSDNEFKTILSLVQQ